ncbi:MAG: TetR/AcrR family transcriptional regulator [Saprospiraceae bacterium]|nr:TetR/AcrR family transcriptional regulator [Saprospiraceae bacterium]
MGISDRKEREKTELRSLILKAAKKLFLEQGIEKTSIRNIADAIEYSPGTIYHYFQDKDSIFHEIHTEGFQELGKKMAVLHEVENPFERLKAMGKIYIKFAFENTDMYDLMFIKQAPMDFLEKMDCEWDEGQATFDVLRHTVQGCMEQGYFKGQELEAVTFMVWSAVHGMVTLNLRHRCKVVNAHTPDEIVHASFQSFIKLVEQQ